MRGTRFILSALVLALLGVALFQFSRQDLSGPRAQVHGVSLKLLVATTTTAEERGLGGRDALPSDTGMLFVFSEPGPYGIWMKDMRFPIDVFWLGAKGQVVSMVRDMATSTYPHVFYPPLPATYVLETDAGFAARALVATGTVFELQNISSVSK